MPREIERIFLGWGRPALDAAAETLLGLAPVESSLIDMSGFVVATPGGRANRLLLASLVAEAERRGCALTPPLFITPGEVASLALGVRRTPASDLTRLLLWARALRETPVGALREALPSPPEPDDDAGWRSVAALLDRTHSAVASGGWLFEDIPRLAASLPDFPDDARWAALAHAQGRYATLVREAGLIDASLARIEALREGAFAEGAGAIAEEGRTLALVGVVELNAVARRAIEALCEQSRGRTLALIAAPDSLSDLFDKFGCAAADAWREADTGLRDSDILFVNGPDEQASAALSLAMSLGEGRPPEDIVLGAPDERVAQAIESAAAFAEGVRVRSASGVPLVNSSPVRLLRLLSDHLAAPTFATLGALVRHPEFGEALAREAGAPDPALRVTQWADALDQTTAERAPRVLENLHFRPDGDGDRRDKRPPRALLDALRETLTLLAPQGGAPPRPLREWADPIARTLAGVYSHGAWRENDPAHRVVIAACNRIRAALDELRALPSLASEPASAAQALRLIAHAAAGGAAPHEADPTAIEMVGWLEVALDPAPVAILTGMNEGAVPSSVVSDALLPDSLRRVLGIEHDAQRLSRDACLLATIVGTREHVRAIAGRKGPEGDPLRPSRLLFHTTTASLVKRMRRFADGAFEPVSWRPIARAPLPGERDLTPIAPLDPRRPPRHDAPTPDAPGAPGVAGAPTIRVTAFRDYLASPYLFYLKHEQRLEERADDAPEVGALAFGTLLHDALRDFARSDARGSRSERDIADATVEALRAIAAERLGRSLSAAVALQLDAAEHRLRAFARWQAQWAAKGWSIAEAEWPGDAELAELHTLGFATLGEGADRTLLTGRIDRIDTHTDGKIAILDYKSGERVESPEKTHGKPGKWKDLQLPLYRLLAKRRIESGRAPDATTPETVYGYICLEKSGDVLERVAKWSPDDVESAIDEARRVVQEIRKGERFGEVGKRGPKEGVFAALAGVALISRAPLSGDSDSIDAGADELGETDDAGEEGEA